jgi:hypothetical protein
LKKIKLAIEAKPKAEVPEKNDHCPQIDRI